MRKLSRPAKPQDFDEAKKRFSAEYPPKDATRTEGRRWKAFGNEEQELYKAIKQALYDNQQGLCAFCECQLTATNKEIEHFVPKSKATQQKDWTINFENYTMSCRGKCKLKKEESPTDLEDDHCGHLKDNLDPQGKILCPYDLPEKSIFTFKRDVVNDGRSDDEKTEIEYRVRIAPDEARCQEEGIDISLVESTIKHLGLDCATLQILRGVEWQKLKQHKEDIVQFFQDNSNEKMQDFVDTHFVSKPELLPQYITMRIFALQTEVPSKFLAKHIG